MTQNKDDSFRIIDRRLFTAEGALREEAAEEKRQREKAAAAKPQPSGKPAETKPAASPAAPPAEAPKELPAFDLLVDLVARNGVAMLGGMADPRTGQPFVDLEGAREVIEMLDALIEKTRGNLTAEEERALLEVSGTLKMSYLELSKATAKAVREKAHG